MRFERLVDALALLGVVIVLIGVTSAANMALAEEGPGTGAALKTEAVTAD